MNPARLTIRARITAGSLLIAILISIAAGIIIFSQVQRIVHEGQVRLLEGVQGQYVTAISTGDTEEFDAPGPGQLVAVLSPTGTPLINTLPVPLNQQLTRLVGGPDEVRTVTNGQDSYLVMTSTVSTMGKQWRVITASAEDTEVLAQVAALLIASVAAITIGFGGAAWFIGSAALSPVTRLRQSAKRLVSAGNDQLLPVGPVRDEISELAQTLNELIRDLRSSAERERQIVSDASHEFRTPIAIIQTRLELAQQQATTLQEMKIDVAAAQKTVAQLSSLATSMLELSRLDSETTPGHATARELGDELADAADRGRARVGGRSIQLDFTIDDTTNPEQSIAVSEADFGRICDNLINNALTAIGEKGHITAALRTDAAGAAVSITDDGGGMTEAYEPHAFDRFSRERRTASRSETGAGLGLPIVASIVARSGGNVSIVNRPGDGLTVTVTLPTTTTGKAMPARAPIPPVD
ncbi:sensor histidine kinase [Microbacterium sp. 1P06AB]|uniref:sensor histidine kinase n=1 Tax=Microbacterium sp. 1P06AB TaxID=3132289 RepID=UPI0039A543C4